MRKYLMITILFILSIPTISVSEEIERSIGALLAAENFCELNFEKAAVENFLDKNIPADDLDFIASIEYYIGIYEMRQKELSGSQKFAYCHQVRRVAESNGFVD